jgi:hypothetical protein
MNSEIEQECRYKIDLLIERGYLDPIRREEAYRKLLSYYGVEPDKNLPDPDLVEPVLHRW